MATESNETAPNYRQVILIAFNKAFRSLCVFITNDDANPVPVKRGGTPFADTFVQVQGVQTKGDETLVGAIDISLEKVYEDFFASVQSARFFQWRLVYDNDGNETTIGYSLTGEGCTNGQIVAVRRRISTVGEAGPQKIKLFATPITQVDEVTANIEFTEL